MCHISTTSGQGPQHQTVRSLRSNLSELLSGFPHCHSMNKNSVYHSWVDLTEITVLGLAFPPDTPPLPPRSCPSIYDVRVQLGYVSFII